MHGPWLNLVIIPFNDPDLFFYRDVSLYIMSARLSLANKWSPPFRKHSRLCQCTRRCGPRAFFEVLFTKMYYHMLNKALVLCDFMLEGEGVSRPYNGLL